jgi:hypothetical protein
MRTKISKVYRITDPSLLYEILFAHIGSMILDTSSVSIYVSLKSRDKVRLEEFLIVDLRRISKSKVFRITDPS